MAVLAVREVVERLTFLVIALSALSRLEALRVLDASDRFAKLEAAERSCVYADLAWVVQEQATRNYLAKANLVYWPRCLHPEKAGLIVEGRINSIRLMDAIHRVETDAWNVAIQLEQDASGTSLAGPVRPLTAQVKRMLPPPTSDGFGIERLADHDSESGRYFKTTTGPVSVSTDPIFTPTYTMLEQPAPIFGETVETSVPYLWTTVVGETMAAELCALSSVEYDGLPLAFHRDMAKQAWDEMRHAVYYLEAAVALLPTLESRLDESDPLKASLVAFRERQAGLPIPRELNLYETVLNSSLPERLILFQIQTEAPGASRKKRNLQSEVCQIYPDLARALEYDLRDEIVHARIGKIWLPYLVPDAAERRQLIEITGLLRGLLLLTSFAHHGSRSLGELMEDLVAGVN
jgi:hypothetical protein